LSGGGVVLVHGANHCAACWDSVLAHLMAPAIAVDLPGRGSRPTTIEGVTLDDCVQVVIEPADQAGLDRSVLVGHSLGGMTVTETAWRHPERVARLRVLDGAGAGVRHSVELTVDRLSQWRAHHLRQHDR
jgi:pimeloyl-ACP methyl ester carboxylesterase